MPSIHRLTPTPGITAGHEVAKPWHDRPDKAVVGREVLEWVEVPHLQVLVEPVAADIGPADERLRAAQHAATADAGLERVERRVDAMQIARVQAEIAGRPGGLEGGHRLKKVDVEARRVVPLESVS